MHFEQLSGVEKAAIVVLSLSEESARQYLSNLGDGEVGQIMLAISSLGEVPPEVQDGVLAEFRQEMTNQRPIIAGGRHRALEFLSSSLDAERSPAIRELVDRSERGIEVTLQRFAPEFVAEVLAQEHPQTIALVLSQLQAVTGAAVIDRLPDALKPDVVVRLAELQSVPREIVADLEDVLAELFSVSTAESTRVGGQDAAARLLNRIEKESGEAILERVDQANAKLADAIRKRMLTFDDLVGIDDRGFQQLLREIATEDLVVALKTSSEEMREKVFANVSSRAAKQLREDGEMVGPMRVSEVEAVQEKVVDLARNLAEEGKIDLTLGESDDVFV